uniref:NADH-ubiquinone oxidoreductase chain 2 n=1 Tax=Urochela quadrinotata TaxID=1176167 RepID=L7NZQ6_UROQU|nr:NADH dehydrogenase subunit 2 [Urochela quadrinotata]AFI54773.1 NADH dehydrogenase subunit 2 [Urochela quadrinotata]
MMKTNIIFYMLLGTSTLITLVSDNWLSMWMGMELNLMMFVPLMNLKPNKNKSEASLIYFLVQASSSVILLSSLLFIMINNTWFMYEIMTMSLLIKLGAAPFHMWMPKIMSTMSWNMNIIFMTWQKIIPLFLLNSIESKNIITISIILSVMGGSLGGLYQTSIRKMMAYSSINHLGWMLSLNKSKDSWIIYLSIYSYATYMVCSYFSSNNLLFINQLFNQNMTLSHKMNFMLLMMSLGGMPPMLGFLPKWLAIEELTQDNSLFLIMIMIMTSMLTLFYYMRIIMKLILFQSTNNKWSLYKTIPNNFMIMINLILPMVIIIY